jgi:hypothetical protein
MCNIYKLENTAFYVISTSKLTPLIVTSCCCLHCVVGVHLAIYVFRAYRNYIVGFDSRREEVYFLRLFCLSFELRVLITPSTYSNFYVRWVSVDILVSSIDKSNYIPKLLLLWR